MIALISSARNEDKLGMSAKSPSFRLREFNNSSRDFRGLLPVIGALPCSPTDPSDDAVLVMMNFDCERSMKVSDVGFAMVACVFPLFSRPLVHVVVRGTVLR